MNAATDDHGVNGVLSTATMLMLERGPPAPVRHALDLGIDAPVTLTERGGEGAAARELGEARWTAPVPDGGARLGDRFRVRRGVATGANDFFVIAADEARRLRLPARHL